MAGSLSPYAVEWLESLEAERLASLAAEQAKMRLVLAMERAGVDRFVHGTSAVVRVDTGEDEPDLVVFDTGLSSFSVLVPDPVSVVEDLDDESGKVPVS